MSARTVRKQGFTLVEILIVVVILGILAAIVIPQFTNASESAKASSLISQLQTIRSQLELYQVQHNGNYPTLAELQDDDDPWSVLVMYTDSDSTTYETKPTDGTIVYGPYLQKAPSNSLSADATDYTSVGAADSTSTAWAYDEDTGKIKAVLNNKISEDKAEDMGLDITNDVVLTAGGGGTP